MQNNNNSLFENIDFFDPLIYKKGRKSYLIGKVNGHLYRISFSFSKPVFLNLYKDKIEPMNLDDVQAILENFNDYDNEELTQKIANLAVLYRTFKENYVKNNQLNPQELYEKAFLFILSHPDFKKRLKEAQTRQEQLHLERSKYQKENKPKVYDFIAKTKPTTKVEKEIKIQDVIDTPKKHTTPLINSMDTIKTNALQSETTPKHVLKTDPTQIRTGKELMLALAQLFQQEYPSQTPLDAFLNDTNKQPHFQSEVRIRFHQNALKNKTKDVFNQKNGDFSFGPYFTKDNLLYYYQNGWIYLVSLDEHNFIAEKKNQITQEKNSLTQIEILALLRSVSPYTALWHKTLSNILENVFKKRNYLYTKPFQRLGPTPNQFFKIRDLQATLFNRDKDEPILYINTDTLIILKKGDTFFKMQPDKQIFDVYENNKIRLMQMDELNELINIIRVQRMPFFTHTLKNHINGLKSSLFEKQQQALAQNTQTPSLTAPNTPQDTSLKQEIFEKAPAEKKAETPADKQLLLTGADIMSQLKEILTKQRKSLSAFELFLEQDKMLGNFRDTLDLYLLQNRIIHNGYNRKKVETFDIPAGYYNDGIIHQKTGDKIYHISLDEKKLRFEYSKLMGTNKPLSEREILDILLPLVKNNETLSQSIRGILPNLLEKYKETKRLRGRPSNIPSMQQLVKYNQLCNLLNNTANTDIKPRLVEGNMIFACLNGIYYKILTDEKAPQAFAFENGEMRPVLSDELDILFNRFKKNHYFFNKAIQTINIQEVFNRLKNKTNNTKESASKPKEVIQQKTPFLETKQIVKEQNMTQNESHKPEKDTIRLSNLKAKEKPTLQSDTKTQKTGIEPLSGGNKTDGFSLKEAQKLAEIYNLFNDDTPNPQDLEWLQDIQIRAPHDTFLENITEFGATDKFFRTTDVTHPNFKFLWQRLLMQRQLGILNGKLKKGDLYNFDFSPVLCSDNVIYTLKAGNLYAISLDKDRPLFKVRNLKNETVRPIKWETVKKIVTRWCLNNEDATKLLGRMESVYHQPHTGKNRANPLPTFRDVYSFYLVKSFLEQKEQGNNTNNFKIFPTVCKGNQIVGKDGPYFYKIEAGRLLKFEKLYGQHIMLMTMDDAINFTRKIFINQATKYISSEMQKTLLDSYIKTHLPLFNGERGQRINPEIRDKTFSKHNNYALLRALRENQKRQR